MESPPYRGVKRAVTNWGPLVTREPRRRQGATNCAFHVAPRRLIARSFEMRCTVGHPLNHLGIRARLALRKHLLNQLDPALQLLVRHRFDAAGMLQLHLPPRRISSCRQHVTLRGRYCREALRRDIFLVDFSGEQGAMAALSSADKTSI